MLTGKDPVIATEINRDHIDRYLLGTVSNNTREAILNAMKKDKGERTANVLQFISELNPPIAHDVSEDTNKTKISKKRHTTRFSLSETAKHINRKWIMALAALTVLGIIIFWSWGRGDQAGSIVSPHGLDTVVIPPKTDVDIAGKTPKEIRNLGNDYQNGTSGKTKDYAKAMKYFRIAAEQGNTDAMVDIGLMYEYGQGVTKDYAEAMKWYQKASEQGNEDAKKQLEKLKARHRPMLK